VPGLPCVRARSCSRRRVLFGGARFARRTARSRTTADLVVSRTSPPLSESKGAAAIAFGLASKARRSSKGVRRKRSEADARRNASNPRGWASPPKSADAARRERAVLSPNECGGDLDSTPSHRAHASSDASLHDRLPRLRWSEPCPMRLARCLRAATAVGALAACSGLLRPLTASEGAFPSPRAWSSGALPPGEGAPTDHAVGHVPRERAERIFSEAAPRSRVRTP
jgi:hypothetical protein